MYLEHELCGSRYSLETAAGKGTGILVGQGHCVIMQVAVSILLIGCRSQLQTDCLSPNRKRKKQKRRTRRRVGGDDCYTSNSGWLCATGGLSGNRWERLQTPVTRYGSTLLLHGESAGVHLWAVRLLSCQRRSMAQQQQLSGAATSLPGPKLQDRCAGAFRCGNDANRLREMIL